MNIELMTEHARELGGLPKEWEVFQWEAFPHGQPRWLYSEVTGAVAPVTKFGNRAGKPNWRKMDKATRRTIVVPDDDHEKWLRAWELKSGKCSECGGDGKELARWNHETGSEYRDCRKCKGTGKYANNGEAEEAPCDS